MKLFSFINYYLSSIQQGIQTMHAALDMAANYRNKINITCEMAASDQFWEWAENHKTVICLNGGNHEDLRNFKMKVSAQKDLRLPWGAFYEDKASLNGVLTCVALVVPESIYKYRYPDDAYNAGIQDQFTLDLIHKINTSRKAM